MNKIQRKAMKQPCPHCEIGGLKIVAENIDKNEIILECSNCQLTMDSDGGYII